MAEPGILVDRATVHRWVIRYSPELLESFNRRKRSVSRKWHVDETYIKVRGQWRYLSGLSRIIGPSRGGSGPGSASSPWSALV